MGHESRPINAINMSSLPKFSPNNPLPPLAFSTPKVMDPTCNLIVQAAALLPRIFHTPCHLRLGSPLHLTPSRGQHSIGLSRAILSTLYSRLWGVYVRNTFTRAALLSVCIGILPSLRLHNHTQYNCGGNCWSYSFGRMRMDSINNFEIMVE